MARLTAGIDSLSATDESHFSPDSTKTTARGRLGARSVTGSRRRGTEEPTSLAVRRVTPKPIKPSAEGEQSLRTHARPLAGQIYRQDPWQWIHGRFDLALLPDWCCLSVRPFDLLISVGGCPHRDPQVNSIKETQEDGDAVP
ncbi:hypothetical protein SRHO_G00276450 [Serrasalmus rhombeus]